MNTQHKQSIYTTFAGIGVSLIGSLCCFGPLILVSLGIGGAWLGTFNALGAYHAYFVGGVALLFAFSFWQLYVQPRRCTNDDACPAPKSLRFQRQIFWIALIIAVALLAFPWYGFVFIS